MYKIAVLNEYHMRNLLLKDDIDFNKFCKDQLIDFIEVSRKDTEKYKELYRDKNKTIDKVREYIEQFEDVIKNFYPYVDTRQFDFKKVKEILKEKGND